MKPIKITVTGADATAEYAPTLTSGMVGLQAEFTFDEAWEGLTKTAVFCCGSRRYPVICQNGTVTVPWEALGAENCILKIGIYGTDAEGEVVIPTVWAEAGKVKEGTKVPPFQPEEATQTVYQQLLALSDKAAKTADSVRRDADNGVFGYVLTEEDKQEIAAQAAVQSLQEMDGLYFVRPDENGVSTLDLKDAEAGVYFFGGKKGVVVPQVNGNTFDTRLLIITKTQYWGNEEDINWLYYDFVAFSGIWWSPRLNSGSFIKRNGAVEINSRVESDLHNFALKDRDNRFSSLQTMTAPLAADDNSTNIPTTQWVNQAIAAALAARGI